MELKRTIYNDLLKWKNSNTGRVLQLEGARQVGKTFILQKFAKENYKNCIYINMIQESGMMFSNLCSLRAKYQWSLHDVFNRYTHYSFRDTKDTIVLIDEIQESASVYSLVRQFAREFNCDFIITGSYLGRVIEKEFFLPAGDIDKLTMYTLSFSEFMDAVGLSNEYESIDLFGQSDHAIYDKIREWYKVYLAIGGYPAAVVSYIESHDRDRAMIIVGNIVDIFVDESSRYFSDIVETTLFKQILQEVASQMLTEKRGNTDLVEELQKRIYHKDSSRITKKIIYSAISWLYNSKVIGYCGSVNNGDRSSVSQNRRFYFLDTGVAFYFLRQTLEPISDISGILNENFVYLCLLRKTQEHLLRGSTPNFCLYKGGELDFFEVSAYDDKVYGIEVKAGKGIGNTANLMLGERKIDYLFLLKGDTYGGKYSDQKYTVPIYLCPRLEFNLGDPIKFLDVF